MTAEIAILNRSALAFAADSAVTMSMGNRTKITETAEKLFELSRNQPLGVMIYNNVEFVGVPLHVLIRKFRSEVADGKDYKSLFDASDDFVDYLNAFPHHQNEENNYLYSLLAFRIKKIESLFASQSRMIIAELLHQQKPSWSSPQRLYIHLLRDAVKDEEQYAIPDYLPDVDIKTFKNRYHSTVKQVMDDCISISEHTKTMEKYAVELAYWLMKSRRGSILLTGLVIGGFGCDDMFPSLKYMEFDGVFFNKLKILSSKTVNIDRNSVRADVVPFAQQEMVERFVSGLDDETAGSFKTFVSDAISELLGDIPQDAEAANHHAMVREIVNNRFKEAMKKLRAKNRQDLLSMVYFMSKKEMAELAHALVEITSHKRRFSTDAQSVGGAIDVAVLTKSEGFVWIKRKHYFDPNINPGYANRISGRGLLTCPQET